VQISGNLYVNIAPSPLFVSAQIQIVNSNSKLYIEYTLYIIREIVICDRLLRNGQSVGVLLWVGTVSLVEKRLADSTYYV
jgi:hypothetical protein